MSDQSINFKVPLTKIVAIHPHPNADKLALAQVYGFNVVIKLDQFKPGDDVLYIPEGSVLSEALEAKLFPVDSKIKLHNRRIRQIKIRGYPSLGMLINPYEHLKNTFLVPERDYSAELGIIKYEEPEVSTGSLPSPNNSKMRKARNKLFREFNGVLNLKWLPPGVLDNDIVVVQEKIHQTNSRYGILPRTPSTWWEKALKFVGLLPKYENCYGSNKVQLQGKEYKGYYDDNVYSEAAKNCDIFNKLLPGETVFGELCKAGIQKNYHYGHIDKAHFLLFDVLRLDEKTGLQRWLSPVEVGEYARQRGFDMVPVLYKGKFDKDKIEKFVTGPSVYYPQHKVREGIVVKSETQYNDDRGNKNAFKWISPDYLSADNTEFK